MQIIECSRIAHWVKVDGKLVLEDGPAIQIAPKKHKAKQKSSERIRFAKSQEWKEAREMCFTTYGKACAECKSTEDIQCDHKLPRHHFPRWALDQRNLRPLCWSCNKANGQRILPEFLKEAEAWE